MPRRTIMIDGYNLNLQDGTGVATYARNLSHCLHQLGFDVGVLYGTSSSPHNALLREIAFFDTNIGPATRWQRILRGAREALTSPFIPLAREVPITGKVIATQFQSQLPYFDRLWNLPRLFQRANERFNIRRKRWAVRVPAHIDLMHWTYPLPIRLIGAKNIYTMHDLVPLRLPYTTLDKKNRYFRLARQLARQADHIVTVSENSKRDIINLLGVPEHRITNTYQAVDIPEKYAGKSEAIVRREVEGTFNLRYRNYLLYFGAIEPKKNIGRLIEAYLGSGIETPLVIVGKLAWDTGRDFRLVDEKIVQYLEQIDNRTITRNRIIRIEHAAFPLLVSLIKGAKAVLFPSLYEGFGLPVLEAMRLGTPVMTSTEGSLPEIAGDGALLVNPYDTLAIAEAIRTLDANAELREALIEKGRARAAQFSPEAYKKRLDELYQRVL